MAATFGWADFNRAKALVSAWAHPTFAGGWFALDRQLPSVRNCCYVVVDETRQVRYVGRVRRRDGGIRGRFSSHHRRHDGWYAVWVIPLADDAPAVAVDNSEAVLISLLQPAENRTTPAMTLASISLPARASIEPVASGSRVLGAGGSL